MKFGLKIFIMSFSLTVIAINLIGINLIKNSFNSNLNHIIDKNIIEINNLGNAVYLNTGELSSLTNSYLQNKVHSQIYFGNKIVFTNMEKNPTIIEELLSNDLDENINSYIKDQKLYMALKRNQYTIYTETDISDVYGSRDDQIDYFVKLSTISSLTIALILSILVSSLTNKIKRLKSSVKEIEKGNYDIEIPNLGKDEIGMFANAFANMNFAIRENIKEIERTSENRKMFIGNLTHEIRTPLTSIIGYSSLIKNGKVKKEATIREYCEKIYEEGKYIENIRDKLMNLLSLDTNSIKLESKNLSKLTTNIIRELRGSYPDVLFKTEIEENIHKKIDETLYKSLLINLIKNAINACHKPVITIALTDECLRIKDNGKGIAKDELEKIKEPFYTLNKDRNRKTSGLGLGLPLAIKITETMHFRMDIKSVINEGTEVIIFLGGEK